MIDRNDPLPITRQCQLLSMNRSTVYYQPRGTSDEELELMRRIDEMHLQRPFYGSRRIRDWLWEEGYDINRKRVQRLMRQMGIAALYPKKGTSRPGKGHNVDLRLKLTRSKSPFGGTIHLFNQTTPTLHKNL